MFCPNCGNNCGDARFCSSCGTKLPQAAAPATQSGEWKVGMPCPHCGATKLNEGCCAFCGAQLVLKEEPKPLDATVWEDSYDFPYRGFSVHGKKLILERDGIAIEESFLFKKTRTKVKFTELAKAELTYNGLIYIKMVFTTDSGSRFALEMKDDDGNEYDDVLLYFMIFFLIRYLANDQTDFVIDLPEAELEIQDHHGATIDLRSYFERFGPSRTDAATALSSEHEMLFEEAYPLIDKSFYLFQRELYENDPIKAVRDYNRIMAERHELYLEAKENRANRGLKRRR